jgi:hypothetical protein
MANHPAPPLDISEDDRSTLTTWSRSRALPQRLVLRACIVLLAADACPTARSRRKPRARSQPCSYGRRAMQATASRMKS